MEVSGQFHTQAALTLGNDTLVPIAQKVEPRDQLDSVKKEKSLVHWESNQNSLAIQPIS
jgi:hypothetical protein